MARGTESRRAGRRFEVDLAHRTATGMSVTGSQCTAALLVEGASQDGEYWTPAGWEQRRRRLGCAALWDDPCNGRSITTRSSASVEYETGGLLQLVKRHKAHGSRLFACPTRPCGRRRRGGLTEGAGRGQRWDDETPIANGGIGRTSAVGIFLPDEYRV